MEVDELNKCLTNFYVSVREADGSYYKKPACCRSELPSTDILKPRQTTRNSAFVTTINSVMQIKH